MSATGTRTPTQVYAILFTGVAAASLAAIFIRFAQNDGTPSAFIAAGRLTLSALILTPFALRSHRAEIARLRGVDLLLAAASGLLLAIHFATWIASLEYTSVLISVVLVGTSPLWSALFEVVFLRMRLHRYVVIGLLIAFAGGLLISLAGGTGGTEATTSLFGGLLSLAGAVTFAIYLVIGRKLRAQLSLVPYIWLVYGFAAIFLILLALGGGVPMGGYTPTSYLMILLLALLPQLVGHSSFNYSLRYLSATFVGIATQTEPISSALIAYLIFNEVPLPMQIVGSVAILAGVIMTSLGQEKETQ
jgi:drug/metabolite transporter (DMT)-like permease